jgi:hypothetical protein
LEFVTLCSKTTEIVLLEPQVLGLGGRSRHFEKVKKTEQRRKKLAEKDTQV